MRQTFSTQRHREHRGLRVKDFPADTILQYRSMEVDKQADWFLQQPQIGNKLHFMNNVERFNGLKFNHNVADNEIGAIGAVEFHALVVNRNRYLTFKGNFAKCQLMT